MNAYEGLVWFIYPCLLVITNDILAYLFGKPFGRKIFKFSLIELSPNKSWEGFIGGLVSTIVMAAIFASYFQEIDYLVCPKLDLTFVPFESLSCTKSPIFI
jgi:phosphatidate cytidylyltransferase